MIFVLAPGASAVKSVLGAFHRAEGDTAADQSSSWELLAFEGFTCSVGFFLAFDTWKPLLAFENAGCDNQFDKDDSRIRKNKTTEKVDYGTL